MSALVLFTVSLGAPACAPGDEAPSTIGIELTFEEAPRVGDALCTVLLEEPDGEPIQGATVSVEGNMNHAGMVPEFGEATEVEPGRYEAPLEFTMGGDWFVIVRAELADGRSLERVIDVPGVALASPGSESP